MPRLFTAIEIPADIRRALSLKCGGLPGARWIEPDDYHITLRFIGNVEDRTADEIADRLQYCAEHPYFEVILAQFDSFGGNKPRSLFARVNESDALTRLYRSIGSALDATGLEPNGRKFSPHVTLARLRHNSAASVAEQIAVNGQFTPLCFTAERFVLLSSRGSTGGGPYHLEQAYALQPPALSQ